MPIELPDAVKQEEWEPSSFTLITPDIYRANIFAVEKKSKEKDGTVTDRWYAITLRIQGGTFDGEDITEQYVGMMNPKSFFRIYNILEAIGPDFLATYYSDKHWKALPTPEELQGKAVYVEVQDEPFQAKDKTTGELKWNDDNTPRILHSSKVNRYYDVTKEKPEFRALAPRITPPSPGSVPAGVQAVMAGIPGAREVAAPQYNAETPW